MNETLKPAWMKDYNRLLNDLQSRNPVIFWLEFLMWLILELMTILGNGLTLKIIFCNTYLRTPSNFLIASLACADFFLALLCSSWCLDVMMQARWQHSIDACQFQGFAALTFACASVLNLMLMALNRYFRVVKTTKYRVYFTSHRTICYIVIVWVASLLGSGLYLPTGHKYIWHPGKYFCYLDIDDHFFLAMVVTFYIALPSLIIAFCYYQVYMVIRRHNQSIFTSREDCSQGLSVQEINITKTLFLIVVMFMMCWLPVFVMDIIDVIRLRWSLPRQAYVAYSFFAATSSAINPILYGIMNPKFRKEYLKTLC